MILLVDLGEKMIKNIIDSWDVVFLVFDTQLKMNSGGWDK